ncbi:uncharacterized protein EV420DRAFT_1745144 [Desarmillaria tabescens]|uniref:Uncharacterized protein n=1 Tax=Armillaria tabescens TaxID=1929756 RepID=A0AA39NDC3_ARMTA|nr:uncharacterized protein EV420DRAFT_1745144 [Desarmillaria tabescens]KAK0463576.1 hypothetical protein EV420DRAFT_1745144 [Desarmillaria tabescens]
MALRGRLPLLLGPPGSVESLFHDFQKDDRFTLNPNIVKDIWIKSGGLQSSNDSQNVTFVHWQRNTIHELYEWFGLHPPYKNMLQTLQDPDAHDAAALLYYNFLGYSGPVYIYSKEDTADFLTAEGVLNTPDTLQSEYQMSSAFVNGLFANKAPCQISYTSSTRFAWTRNSCRMYAAGLPRRHMFLFVGIKDGGHTAQGFMNPSCQGYSPVGSARLTLDGVHPNIILTQGTPTERTIILEVAEYSDATSVQSQILRAVKYKDLLSADEAWLVHFTREDDYEPIWQSSDEFAGGMNVVHFQHDAYFSNVVMSARWRDSKGQDCQIMKEIIELK